MHLQLLTGYTFKPWNSLWPASECSTLLPPGCPWLVLCINCLLSLFYWIKDGMKNKACSLSMTCIYLCYVKAKKNICRGLPEEGAFSFSLANQCQARAGMRKEGGESLLAIWPYPSGCCVPFFLSLNCKMGNSHTRFVPFTNKEGAGTDLSYVSFTVKTLLS